jgi:hypothetical protein
MREIRSYGSVRGVVGDRYPYRDSQNLFGFEPPAGCRRLQDVLKPPKARVARRLRQFGRQIDLGRLVSAWTGTTRSVTGWVLTLGGGCL